MKKSERLGMRVDPKDKAKWEKAAARSGVSLSSWMETWLNWAAQLEEKIRDDLQNPR